MIGVMEFALQGCFLDR